MLRDKFDSLQHITNKNIVILTISETKIDFSLSSAQFYLKGYATSCKLDRNANGGDRLWHKTEEIPSTLIGSD